MALVVVMTGALLGFFQSGGFPSIEKGSFHFIIAILLGSMAFLFGSVLPDIDGKGRIRWTIGPVCGMFVMLPPVIADSISGGPMSGLDLLWNEGVRLFFVFTLIGTLLALIPMKHRGSMHSIRTGTILSSIWGCYIWLSTSLSWRLCLLIVLMGLVGYLWHLSLDGKLTGKDLVF